MWPAHTAVDSSQRTNSPGGGHQPTHDVTLSTTANTSQAQASAQGEARAPAAMAPAPAPSAAFKWIKKLKKRSKKTLDAQKHLLEKGFDRVKKQVLLLIGEIEAKRRYIHELEDELRSEIAARSADENNIGTNYLVSGAPS